MTTQPLAQPEAISEPQRGRIPTDENQRIRRLLLWGFIIMIAGAAVGVIGKKLIYEDIVTVLGVLMSLAGMFVIVYPYLVPSSRAKSGSSPSRPADLADSQPPKSLPDNRTIEYVPSITERTTGLLDSRPATPRKRKESGECELRAGRGATRELPLPDHCGGPAIGKQKAEGGRQKAEGRRQKADGRRQKAKGSKQ